MAQGSRAGHRCGKRSLTNARFGSIEGLARNGHGERPVARLSSRAERIKTFVPCITCNVMGWTTLRAAAGDVDGEVEGESRSLKGSVVA